MPSKIRWGILGAGNIAHSFAKGLLSLPDAGVQSVASRTPDKLETFAAEYGIPVRHASYEALASDPSVDVVYIAVPHSSHYDMIRLCLEHGKHVVCEKPMTYCALRTREAAALARNRKLFLMEAMWTRFFPLMQEVRIRIARGEIGEIRMIQADFGFRADIHPEGRLFDPNLAGGSLLDVGVYPISLFHMLLGKPRQITGFAAMGGTGVDEQAAWVFRYDGGQLAIGSSAVRTSTPHEALIAGTEGSIHIASPWWKPTRMTLRHPGKPDATVEHPLESTGMQYEAAAAMECIRNHRIECPVIPLDESIAIAESMDELRRQWGFVYPMEH